MFGIANEAWKKEQEINTLQSNQRYLILSGDGRDIMLTASIIFSTTKTRKKILATSLIHATEPGGYSKRMDKAGLIKVLEEVKQKQLKIKSLTNDLQ